MDVSESIRIFVAVEVLVYRDALMEMLSRESDMEVVGSWNGSRDNAVVTHARPDVIVLHASGADDVTAIGRMRRAAPAARVVMVALPDAEADVVACAEAGAAGLVTESATVDDLIAALRGATRGEVVCSPRTAAALLRRVAARAACHPRDRLEPQLTLREWEIVELIDSGLSNKEIATHLGIQLATVKNHVHNLLSKLEVESRLDVAGRLRQTGNREAVRLLEPQAAG